MVLMEKKMIKKGLKKVTLNLGEVIEQENYIVCTHASTDLDECTVLDSDKVVFPQTGIFSIPLPIEKE